MKREENREKIEEGCGDGVEGRREKEEMLEKCEG